MKFEQRIDELTGDHADDATIEVPAGWLRGIGRRLRANEVMGKAANDIADVCADIAASAR